MTVRRNSENRNGATLILSEEELEYIWHKLNVASSRPFTDYIREKGLTYSEAFKYGMWDSLNHKYTPRGQ